MTPPALSIVIPTYKRAPILRECLQRIEAQTIKDRIEVIIISDGHDDETAALFNKHTQYAIPNTQFFEIPKSQQGVARNRGIERATGNIILLIGDDIFLAPDACEAHLRAHQQLQTSSAVLGYTEWDPAMDITPVMKWLDKTGWQFGYPLLHTYIHSYIPQNIQHRFSYTSHISLPREVALKFPFREDVTLYGWEDIEWGWRLSQSGIPLYYEPNANAFHHHRMTLADSLRRMETLGTSATIVEKMNPELHLVPHGIKRMGYRLSSLLPTTKGRHAGAFLRGVMGTEHQ